VKLTKTSNIAVICMENQFFRGNPFREKAKLTSLFAHGENLN
jgi:hypothetical protein